MKTRTPVMTIIIATILIIVMMAAVSIAAELKNPKTIKKLDIIYADFISSYSGYFGKTENEIEIKTEQLFDNSSIRIYSINTGTDITIITTEGQVR